jgi:hypothetical protein
MGRPSAAERDLAGPLHLFCQIERQFFCHSQLLFYAVLRTVLLGSQPNPSLIAAAARTNKTMPRLLAVSQGSQIVIAGPSIPLHPLMFEYGVQVLGGLLVEDDNCMRRNVAEGGQKGIFSAGSRMVKVQKYWRLQPTLSGANPPDSRIE